MATEKDVSIPIAIVGMAFRFPGDKGSHAEFWQALKEGEDLVTSIGPERWAVDELEHPKRSEPGRSITFSAGVLSRIEEFDAGFFGISPREALQLDPQQRLLLELAWEAMENSGIVPSSLAGSDCSVSIGVSGGDYGMRIVGDVAGISPSTMTGNALSITANRLSYVFDLRGPSVAVDTACSSSLVALHQACSSLRSGDSSIALAGGVNLLLHPYPFIGFSKASMLSANGRCRSFDAAGDGYVRAEGGAVLILKRLEQAIADGDHVEAVILACGTNSDGSRKTGITIPSAQGQMDLMRDVLNKSGLAASDVDYIEAHGTGTAVGDPIEAKAIGEVYGRARSGQNPLPIGSVKANVGHLESASGMAGLVKAILVLQNRALPQSLHFVTPNPNIDFKGLNLDVVTSYRSAFAPGDKRAVVGVNSFGFGGTNGHALLQEYVPHVQESAPESDTLAPPLFLSARTPQALRDLAARYAALLEERPGGYYDIAFGAAMRREHMETRLALLPAGVARAAHVLSAFGNGGQPAEIVTEQRLAGSHGVAFVYSGNGAQWQGMGVVLMAESPRFMEILAELDAPIRERAGFSIIAELRADATVTRMTETAVAQPLLFAIQVAVTILLKERGIVPRAVAGHSVGEVAAAWAAGALSMDQAIDVICARSAAQDLTRGSGRMAAAALSAEAARELIVAHGLSSLEIAGTNSPKDVTLSGSLDDLEALGRILDHEKVFFRILDLDYAFHSRKMDPILDGLAKRLAPLAPASATAARYVSTVTGGELSGTALGAGYWVRNVRDPVQFKQAVSALHALDCRVFVEIGPHAILQRYLSACLGDDRSSYRVLPTLLRTKDTLAHIDEAASRVHMQTGAGRLDDYFPRPGKLVRLPNYPWQRERHWIRRSTEGYPAFERRRIHPLLGWRLQDAPAAWENVLDVVSSTWLADHSVAGSAVLPGAAYVEMALAAAKEQFGGGRLQFEELQIIAPIVLDGDHARSVRFELFMRDGSFEIRSRQRLSEDEWALNASGRLLAAAGSADVRDAIVLAGASGTVIDAAAHYHLAEQLGLEYGPAFRCVARVELHERALAGVLNTDALGQDHHILHPAITDACFQALIHLFRDEFDSEQATPFLPVKVGGVVCYSEHTPSRFSARIKRHSARSILADFDLIDADGNIVATLRDCRFRAAVVHHAGQAEPMRWNIVPRVQPLVAESWAAEFPAARALKSDVRAWLAEQEPVLKRDAHFKVELPLFEALTVAFASEAFQTLFSRHEPWLQQVLTGAERVGTAVEPLFLWVSGLLRQEGILRCDADGRWTLTQPDLPSANSIWGTLLRECPTSLPELVAASSIGQNLPSLLRGDLDPAALRSRLSLDERAEALYDESPAYLGTRLAAQRIVSQSALNWPAHRRLAVLEIGVGTGGVMREVARHLPPDRLDYVIAVAGETSCDRLEAEFAECPWAQVVSVTGDQFEPASEAVLPEAFDIVIVRHCLHRSGRPADALANLWHRMAPGALLLVAERHADSALDFVSGLDPAWWRKAEADTPVSPLMAPAGWEHLLVEHGFAEVGTLREHAGEDLAEGAYLVVGTKPRQAARNAAMAKPAGWLLVCDREGDSRDIAGRLRRLLESQGQRVVLATQGHSQDGGQVALFVDDDDASNDALIADARRELGQMDHIVHLAGLNPAPEARSAELSGQGRLANVLRLVQALMRAGESPRLWLVAPGGALVDAAPRDLPADPVQGALWGLARVVMNEYPALGCTLVDLDVPLDHGNAAHRLSLELLHNDGAREILLSSHARHTLRMERAEKPDAGPDDPARQYRLDFRVPGQLRNLVWLPQQAKALAEDEVEVEVKATGLNFRDVMYLMGLLPDEAVERGFAGATLGLEFSGVVTRVGKRAGNIEVGDEVMGFGPASFSSHVVTRVNAISHKPAKWRFEEAATVPTVFFTVYYALKHLANLQAGERVLIHGGAGGVGIAAIQLALHVGAEVFATAGSPEKKDFVKLLGASHVLDSRSLTFADDIMRLTDGEGVDVILNSLAGEAVRRNLAIMKPFGRFLELGKRDFFENTPVGLRPFKDNLSYFGIDADQLLVARPELAGKLFREVMGLFRDGTLFPLPYRTYPSGRVLDAFRAMQQSQHIGKIIVTFDRKAMPAQAARTAPVPQRGTWIVTGGLSGFGLESARWLARNGATCLVLVSRRGMATPGAVDVVRELAADGIRVEVAACDVGDRAGVEAMLADVRHRCPPLTGILHAAMVLDDALIANLDDARLRKVLAPKLVGAWHLHELTQDCPLEHFIVYSSITTLIGNPGQANYVAANGGLESLVALRRSLGLPATSIGWGPIGDAGYLSRNTAIKEHLATYLGAPPLTAREALDAMASLIAGGQPRAASTAVVNFDWQALSRNLPFAADPRFDTLRKRYGFNQESTSVGEDVRLLIAGKTHEEARLLVQSLVIQEVAQILYIGADRIDTTRSLLDMGMDSLMGVELAVALEKRFGIQLPVMILNEGPNVERVSLRIVERLLGTSDAHGQDAGTDLGTTLQVLAAQHGENLSKEETDQAIAFLRSANVQGAA